jgi:hypothetical protein
MAGNMLPDFLMRVAEDDKDRKLLSDVQQHGWHVLHIPADESGPCFSFSVGFYLKFGHPEVLIMGLAQPVAHELINLVGGHLTTGRVYRPRELVGDLVEGFPCSFVSILPEHYREYLGYGMWFYRSLKQPFPALQLVWPDKQGRFPWDDGYDQRFLQFQKLLDAP